MKNIERFLLVSVLFFFIQSVGLSQCSTTVSFDVWLSASQSSNQNVELSGAVTSITFNLDFYGPGGEWPADMIVVIYSPNGNCVGGEGYNINPPSSCYDINFPTNWTSTANGFYTYTMFVPTNYLSGDGTWYFTVQNGWTSASGTNYDLDIILNGICDVGGCTNPWACNYDPDAAFSDNSLCEYPEIGYDCDGNCILDTDGDGICDMYEIPGCDDFAACNYVETATDNDGTCYYAEIDEDCNGNSLLPSFTNPPSNMTASCSSVPNPTTVYAQISPFASDYEANYNPDGNCYASTWTVNVTSTEEFIPGDCPGNYQIQRVYTGTDCMGRQCEHTQIISVVDNSSPVFIGGLTPQETTCPLLTTFQNATIIDMCSEPLDIVIGEEQTLPGGCDGEYTLYRTITATDACGNSSTAEQTIVVFDETPPVWTELIPSQVISDEIETGDFGMPQAEDLCSNSTINVTNAIGPGNCPLAIELTRTFIAVDDCGNMSEPFIQVVNETTDLVSYVTGTTDASCSYSNDGSVDIETLGGVAPYETEFGNLDPENLPTGDYEITVTDDNLCAAVIEFSIGAPPALQISLSSELPECLYPSSGTITASAAGGTGDLEFDYDGIDPTAVEAGEYTITVTDANGCTLSDEIIVEPAIIPIIGDLDGDTEVMLGDSSVYEYEFTAGSTYEWTFSGADSLVVSDIFAISLLWGTEGEGFVCVQETNSSGCVGEQVCLDINVGVGVNEVHDLSKIIAYPNPTNGTFNCLVEDLEGVQNWRLIDLSGTIVETGNVESSVGLFEFDFSRHSSGQYILLLDSRAIPVVIEK